MKKGSVIFLFIVGFFILSFIQIVTQLDTSDAQAWEIETYETQCRDTALSMGSTNYKLIKSNAGFWRSMTYGDYTNCYVDETLVWQK